jgi:hypothetical protein
MLGAFLVLGAALGARAEDTKQAPPPEGAVTGVWGENATADHKTKTMDSNISHWQRTADNNWGTNGSVPFIGSGTSHDLVFYFDISDLPKGTKVVKATLEISMETYFRSENAPEVRLAAR